MSNKWLLQIAVAVAGLVPVAAGGLGALWPELVLAGPPHVLTHGAYLSGLLLGIGLGYWSLIPTIERQGRAFAILSLCVLLGGLARLGVALRLDAWSLSVTLPLVLELGITPLLWLWQRQVARSSLLPPE